MHTLVRLSHIKKKCFFLYWKCIFTQKIEITDFIPSETTLIKEFSDLADRECYSNWENILMLFLGFQSVGLSFYNILNNSKDSQQIYLQILNKFGYAW